MDINVNDIKKYSSNKSYPLFNKAKQTEEYNLTSYPVIGNRHPFTFYENLDWLKGFLSYAKDNNINIEELFKEVYYSEHKNKK